ncbi:MAG TPA: GxxExxY protein [Candidatus Methylacidiphilales bacterium]|jgi:GxxExxY protein|nr:GxxExxY protein [Candidatus Methylacidiphilales bacterium]
MKNRVFATQQPHDLLAQQIVGLAMKVHRTLGCGFVETVYRNALVIELRKANISFKCHPILSVMYEGTEVGVFQADIIIEKKLIVELKAVETLTSAHAAQLINYLAVTKIEEGLLINFGATSMEFRTKTLHYQKKQEPPNLHT